MGLFHSKKKFEKIQRTDVVENIIQIKKMQQDIVDDIAEREKEIAKMLADGRKARSRELQLVFAKRIKIMQHENQQLTHRLTYLDSNLRALNQLKLAIDDKEFLTNNSDMPLNKLLNDTTALRKFLSSLSQSKMSAESKLSSTLETFEDVEDAYEENESIYGTDQQDEELLAMFEVQNSEDDEISFGDATQEYNQSPAKLFLGSNDAE